MNIMNWNPFKEIEDMFVPYYRRPGVSPSGPGNGREMLTGADWFPVADIEETSKEFIIKMELPKTNKDDVKVTINKDILNIEGERRF